MLLSKAKSFFTHKPWLKVGSFTDLFSVRLFFAVWQVNTEILIPLWKLSTVLFIISFAGRYAWIRWIEIPAGCLFLIITNIMHISTADLQSKYLKATGPCLSQCLPAIRNLKVKWYKRNSWFAAVYIRVYMVNALNNLLSGRIWLL